MSLDAFLSLEAKARQDGFFSAYDSGWERGFVSKPVDSDLYTVYRINTGSGACNYEIEIDFFNSVETAMVFLATRLVKEISHQCADGNPVVVL